MHHFSALFPSALKSKQANFNRVSGSANPITTAPTRSRFAHEAHAGEAHFYPPDSPTPSREMSRRGDELVFQYDRLYYAAGHTVEELNSYKNPPPSSAKKKSRWKKLFSRKKKEKEKEQPGTYAERPLPALPPLSTYADLYDYLPPAVIPPRPRPQSWPRSRSLDSYPSNISVGKGYDVRDPGFISPSQSALSAPAGPPSLFQDSDSVGPPLLLPGSSHPLRSSISSDLGPYQVIPNVSYPPTPASHQATPSLPALSINEDTRENLEGVRASRESLFQVSCAFNSTLCLDTAWSDTFSQSVSSLS